MSDNEDALAELGRLSERTPLNRLVTELAKAVVQFGNPATPGGVESVFVLQALSLVRASVISSTISSMSPKDAVTFRCLIEAAEAAQDEVTYGLRGELAQRSTGWTSN